MRFPRKLMMVAAVLIGAAVLVSVARDRWGGERLPVADDCISAVRTNRCDVDLVVHAGDLVNGRRIWLRPDQALPRDAQPPFHACELPNLPVQMSHRFIPGARVWGCELPPRRRGD
ncbi:MAG: hypothetical protein ACJASC_001624 [Limimaricola cinnabarinus]|jgi:hypothetical protein|uniref:hypothetical protein n=1 Tax=Limimaricola cinnabarinus TaxID=1125964 RepID=UPI0039E495E0